MLGARPVGLQELFDLQFNIKHGRGGAGLFYPRPPIFAIMSSPRQPNAQCPRTDDAPHNDSELQRDTGFWFEDGNVVVVAQQTAYRVHRGVLSRHSETFSGLFTLPRPVDGASDEKVEGCPGVRVTDSSHDFKHLLHALYDGLGYVLARHNITTPNRDLYVYVSFQIHGFCTRTGEEQHVRITRPSGTQVRTRCCVFRGVAAAQSHFHGRLQSLAGVLGQVLLQPEYRDLPHRSCQPVPHYGTEQTCSRPRSITAPYGR